MQNPATGVNKSIHSNTFRVGLGDFCFLDVVAPLDRCYGIALRVAPSQKTNITPSKRLYIRYCCSDLSRYKAQN